jgi:hypothetical protein
MMHSRVASARQCSRNESGVLENGNGEGTNSAAPSSFGPRKSCPLRLSILESYLGSDRSVRIEHGY